jgi:hypothetical protein
MAEPTYVVGSVPGFANRTYAQPYDAPDQRGLTGGSTAADISDWVGGLLGDIDFGQYASIGYPEGDWYDYPLLTDYFVPFGSTGPGPGAGNGEPPPSGNGEPPPSGNGEPPPNGNGEPPPNGNGEPPPNGNGGNGGDNGGYGDDWYDVVGPNMDVWVGSTGPEPEYGTSITGNPHVDIAGGITAYVPTPPVIPDISGLLDPMDEYDFGYVAPQVDDFSWGYIDQDPWAFEDRRGGRR